MLEKFGTGENQPVRALIIQVIGQWRGLLMAPTPACGICRIRVKSLEVRLRGFILLMSAIVEIKI